MCDQHACALIERVIRFNLTAKPSKMQFKTYNSKIKTEKIPRNQINQTENSNNIKSERETEEQILLTF